LALIGVFYVGDLNAYMTETNANVVTLAAVGLMWPVRGTHYAL